MSCVDENEYYEFNYPLCTVGGKEFIKDNNRAPEPKISESYSASEDKLTVTRDYLLSGAYGNWNDFCGKIGIKRENGKWQAWFIKRDDGNTVKQLMSTSKSVTGAPSGNLAYITIYMGTNNAKPSSMSFSNISVKNLNPKTYTNNIRKFEKGDVVKVDCYNNKVFLNDIQYSNFDIGSQFFSLEVGENIIKTSSDKGTHTSVIFNEKFS